MSDPVKLSRQAWLDKGTELFGADFNKWRFVCPGCGNIAAVEEFRPFKDKGADASSATSECIGRYSGGDWAKGTKPCNYAGYGLFRLSPIYVINEDGHEIHSFAFDGWPESELPRLENVR